MAHMSAAWSGGISAILLLWLASGCARPARPIVPEVRGPVRPAMVRLEDYPVQGAPGCRLVSPHYVIYSTVSDRQVLVRMGELMEGALQAYRTVAPDVPVTSRTMECYLFEDRAQWAAFTRRHTGDDASIYLRVNRGGYTVGDWFVAYWIGDSATFSVAAHEGWHQYVARHLRGRLPPFLEEGLACLFEQVRWEGDLPRWDLSKNAPRLASLRAAVNGDYMYALDQLVRMHAGQVVGKHSSRLEAFYSQGWAFARFLYDGEHGRYRPALRRMLADAAHGVLFDDSSQQLSRGPLWDPATARPMLEHYLGMSLPQIEQAYARYVRHILDDSAETGF